MPGNRYGQLECGVVERGESHKLAVSGLTYWIVQIIEQQLDFKER